MTKSDSILAQMSQAGMPRILSTLSIISRLSSPTHLISSLDFDIGGKTT